MNDLLQQATEHHRAGRLAQAEQAYRQILAAQPDNSQVVQLFGALLSQSRRIDELIVILQNAVRANPNLGDQHNDLALALEDAGRLDESLPHYQRAIELCPTVAEYHSNFGAALQVLGRSDQAI